jgi:hypothetical protein
MRRTVWLVFLVLAATVAQGAEVKGFIGTWVMRIGQRNLFVLTLTPDGKAINGTFKRPQKFSSGNGTFANMRGGVWTGKVVSARFSGDALYFTVQNANNANDKDSYVMTVHGDQAQLAYDDLPPETFIPPYSFERAHANARVATDWEPNRLYVPGEDSDTPSAAMKAIFTEDQRVRTSGKIDWKVVNKSDAKRRQQTRQLLAKGALHTGKDYEEAAFVFQHGDSSNDYLLAHTLAMVAVSKGDATAIWIAAATLDRYLEKIGQKQIFGTQYSLKDGKQWTQEPYDRELVSDALRRQLAVPTQAQQAVQLKMYQSQR